MSIPTLATTMPTPSCGCSLSCNGDFCPVDLATGGIEYFDSFLQTIYGSFDIAWFNLYRDNSGNAEDRNRNMGFNWSSRQMAYYDILDDDSIRIIFAPDAEARRIGLKNTKTSTSRFSVVMPR